jgi:hypothetical protein
VSKQQVCNEYALILFISPIPDMKRDIKKDKRKEVESDQSPPEKILKKRQPSPTPVTTFNCGEFV